MMEIKIEILKNLLNPFCYSLRIALDIFKGINNIFENSTYPPHSVVYTHQYVKICEPLSQQKNISNVQLLCIKQNIILLR
jgi:hypothetical protein